MVRYWRLLVSLGVVLSLTSCAPRALERFTIPKREPITESNGSPGRGRLTLQASTNCAEIGEEVTWTLTIANPETYPLTLIGTPPIDMVLGPEPEQRWSATDQFPGSIDPMLQPGEERVYEWRWIAEAAYAQNPLYPGATLWVRTGVINPSNPIPQGNGVGVGVGVKFMQDRMRTLACSELR